MYNQITENIKNNFLNKGYLYTCGYDKNGIIDKLIENSIFDTHYDYEHDILNMDLGDNINIKFNFIWEQTSYITKYNKEIQHYRLIEIG